MFAQQNSVAFDIENGLIAIDEHSSVSCMVYNVTATGLSLVLLDGAEVPNIFVLSVGAQARVCTVLRRSDEEIEALFADVTSVGQSIKAAITTPRSAFGQRRSGQSQRLRRAA